MIKKITVFLIVTLLMLSFAVPAFAEASIAEKVFDAYKAVEDALAAKDPDGFIGKTDALFDKSRALGELSDEERAELVSLMGAADIGEAEAMITNLTDTAAEIAYVGSLIAAYQADPAEETARALVEHYDLMRDSEYYEASAFERVCAFYPNFGTVAEEARAMIPAADVQAIYDALQAVIAARAEGTAKALREVEKDCEYVDAWLYRMNNSEMALLAALMGVEGEYEVMQLYGEAAYYLYDIAFVDSLLEEMEDGTVEGARSFVEYYDALFNNSEDADEELQTEIRKYFPDIDEQYEDAKALIPEVDAEVMYEAYKEMKDAVDKRDIGAIRKARGKMEIAVEMFNSMKDEDEKALAELIGGEFEDAMNSFLRVNVYASVVLNADELIDAYAEAPTEENAAALIEFYDALFGESEYPMGSLGEIVREALPELEDAYEAAKKLEPFKRPVAQEEEKADPNIPLTGDDSALPMMLLAAMICAAGAVILSKKAFAKK